MPKRGENIYKRKDGRWEGRYICRRDEAGKAKYAYVYAKTYTEVKNRLSLCRAAPPRESERHATAPTYNALLDDWLRAERPGIKESTYARYAHLIKTHIKPRLGEYRLSQLSPRLIEDYVTHELTDGRLDGRGGLSAKSVADILAVVKSSVEYANRRSDRPYCDLGSVSVKRRKKEREMRVLSREEQARLVATLTRETDMSKFGVLLALYTGIRIGELCALKWEDVSLGSAVLYIRKTMQRVQLADGGAARKTRVIVTEPKSQCSIREIPLPAFLVDYARQLTGNGQEYILTGDKERFVEPRTMQNRFKAYAAQSGIERVNFHALRHTFATRCVELGFEVKSLSEILGHASVNITLNRYVHSSFELKCSNMNKLALTL